VQKIKKVTKVDRINTLNKSLESYRDSYSKLTKKLSKEICKAGINSPILDSIIQKRNNLSTLIHQTVKMVANLKDGKGELGDSLSGYNVSISDLD
jgi:hypothetical protein